MRVAIIGSGISGCAAAYALKDVAEIIIYEASDQFGGHAHTVEVDYDGTRIDVDVGFIVYNELNYPNFTALLRELAVDTQPSRMSFSASIDGGRIEWCGKSDHPLSGLFAQRSNLFSPAFWGMLRELLRFQRQALADLDPGVAAQRQKVAPGEMTLGEYVARHRFSRGFCDVFLFPMGTAIWSMSPAAMADFPARTFLTFFNNHRLLHRQRPLWRTVAGGSRRYVERLTNAFHGAQVGRLGCRVTSVRRTGGKIIVADAGGQTDSFDHVVLATSAPDALAMLDDPTNLEREALSNLRTSSNAVYLHRDPSLMPRRQAAWGAWNVGSRTTKAAEAVSVTYWMNTLQDIGPAYPLFVSLNPVVKPRAGSIFAEFTFAHPVFDAASQVAVTRLAAVQGTDGVWFCGAWTGYGFHEDGLKSGLAVAEALGGSVSWRSPAATSSRQRAAA